MNTPEVGNTSPGQNRPLPPVAPHFSHIARYWDAKFGRFVAKITPGQYYAGQAGELICTVLGSCISACIRDTELHIGGMNHFMLPAASKHHQDSDQQQDLASRYGNYAMEYLIQEIIKLGGRKELLEVKIFGGGQIIKSMANIGEKNISFVEEYVRDEGLTIAAEDVGGIHPREIIYAPDSGQVLVKRLRSLHNNTISAREQAYNANIGNQANTSKTQ